MARVRSWEVLSPTHRKRLLADGISREAYESGINLRAARQPAIEARRSARGTSGASSSRQTPLTREELEGLLIRRKREFFSETLKYDGPNQRDYVRFTDKGRTVPKGEKLRKRQDEIPKPTLRLMRRAAKMSMREIEEMASLANDDTFKEWRFLWYH